MSHVSESTQLLILLKCLQFSASSTFSYYISVTFIQAENESNDYTTTETMRTLN